MKFSLRDARAEDQAFLFQLYASTREQEISAWGWTPEQSDAFLRMQFQAQQASYGQLYPDARHQVIEVEGQAIGRILVAHEKEEIRLVDIALFPRQRNQKIGETLLRELMEECSQEGRPLRLQVLRANPAQHLYHRLGFTVYSEDPIYVAMEWLPTN